MNSNDYIQAIANHVEVSHPSDAEDRIKSATIASRREMFPRICEPGKYCENCDNHCHNK